MKKTIAHSLVFGAVEKIDNMAYAQKFSFCQEITKLQVSLVDALIHQPENWELHFRNLQARLMTFLMVDRVQLRSDIQKIKEDIFSFILDD